MASDSDKEHEQERPENPIPGEWSAEDDADYQAWLATWRVLPDTVPIEDLPDDVDIREMDDNPPW